MRAVSIALRSGEFVQSYINLSFCLIQGDCGDLLVGNLFDELHRSGLLRVHVFKLLAPSGGSCTVLTCFRVTVCQIMTIMNPDRTAKDRK